MSPVSPPPQPSPRPTGRGDCEGSGSPFSPPAGRRWPTGRVRGWRPFFGHLSPLTHGGGTTHSKHRQSSVIGAASSWVRERVAGRDLAGIEALFEPLHALG